MCWFRTPKAPLAAPNRPATGARVQRKRLKGGRWARTRASARASAGPAHLPRLPHPFVDGAQRLIRGLPPEGPRGGRGYKSTPEDGRSRPAPRQQKCLVHLLRDFNQDILANPWDEELKSLARVFGGLL